MRIAFLSINDLSGYVTDDELAFEPLQELGHIVEFVPWQQTAVGWQEYDAVIIRTTWDYQNHLTAFLSVLQQIEAQTRLANPLEIVRWNADKIYLKELESKGARVVQTIWINSKINREQIEEWFYQLQSDEIIIKPRVSANAQDTFRLKRGHVDTATLSKVFDHRPCLVQPFMPEIVAEGEFSLFYFNGEYSHAILKTPQTADFRVQEEHGGIIQAIKPAANLLAAGAEILHRISSRLLYARVDFVRTESDEFALMELELIEPSLYLRTAESAPRLFASAINRWLSEKSSSRFSS
jgi:glutathione synthase/RimK-type ligase-like ATP-grasp enzyme